MEPLSYLYRRVPLLGPAARGAERALRLALIAMCLVLGPSGVGAEEPAVGVSRKADPWYTIQVQSAPAAARSRLLETYVHLKAKGHLVYCRDAHVHDRAYVRLRAGLFGARDEAQQYAETIRKSEGFDYFIAQTDLAVESFGDVFDVVATPNDIWFRSDTSLRALYHFDTVQEAMTCSGIRICPAGRRIVFSCDNRIMKIDVRDGSTLVLRQGETEDALFQSILAWSPDGQYIAYLDRTGFEQPTRLWIMRSDGSQARRLIGDNTGRTRVKSVRWHPSGNELFYVSGPAHGTVSVGGSLHRVDLHGHREIVIRSSHSERTEVSSRFRVVDDAVHYRLAHFDEDYQVRQYSTHILPILR